MVPRWLSVLFRHAVQIGLAGLLAGRITGCLAQAASMDVAYNVSQLGLPDILAGIIHYTRWPALSRSQGVQLCMSESDVDAQAIASRFARPSSADDGPVSVSFRPMRFDAPDFWLDCQVVYFGDLPAERMQTMQRLLARLSASPVLTIGLGDEFCAHAGLFCLVPTPHGIRINANLDSIARSGLRINPRLLKLTLHEGETRP